MSLVSNAVKFTEKGNVKIVVKIYQSTLVITVEDTGVGIKEEDQDKLFKLFGFIENQQNMNTQGIGLGLVIADQIVNQFNGKITFLSEHEVGSKFTFTMELEEIIQ